MLKKSIWLITIIMKDIKHLSIWFMIRTRKKRTDRQSHWKWEKKLEEKNRTKYLQYTNMRAAISTRSFIKHFSFSFCSFDYWLFVVDTVTLLFLLEIVFKWILLFTKKQFFHSIHKISIFCRCVEFCSSTAQPTLLCN